MLKDQQAYVSLEYHDQWLEITLNRPASFNALSQKMMAELQEAIFLANENDTLTCIIIKAKGKAFSAGHDLKEMQNHATQNFYQELFKQCSQLMQSIVRCPIPVIAQVQGVATAAGCQLVASCDLAIASNNARFAVSGINLGLFCSTPAVALSRNIHPKHAMEMLLTGDFITADKAVSLGLVNQVVTDDELEYAARAMARKLSQKAKAAVRTGKAMFYPQLDMPLEQAYDYASEHMLNNLKDEQTQTGLNAFVFKKPQA
ncbi:enoyl-CoA hydratase [Oceanospirillaceae bacterium]|jgi:enoyl-CoA hydratase/carnithine racemase|uniref:enoyl-CoA hydratase n=1 Tax=Candidatus Njordibacter sp. Uisw_002 TaxID=3230971 RepID=UPI00233DECE8|nr:enoyl-CoA hydratase [Oceanospirillaceae bacterium]MDB9958242.1 enoyl-CoA hydratase [Oceanospirillaceae bacterium]MDC1340520.1 enoyl-CoA hydratase [Oceanospirillaceae bacterium]|tara:strand:+ start:2864 stop:3640 length:777 start_codon:yes stop_codon:yes gene_type:complete